MFGDKKVIAVIPARGGSKRIPKKNIADFHGKPMMAWTIEAARNSKYIDRVFVLTDCQEIAQVAKEYGAEVPFLRTDDADDFTPISVVTVSGLNKLNWKENGYDIVVQLMANCPIRGTQEVDEGVQLFVESKAHSQISFFKYGFQNPWWAHYREDGSPPKKLFKETLTKRSQDLPELYCPTGAIWIANVARLCEAESFYMDGYQPQLLNWKAALDIDDNEDLELAKAVFLLNRL